MDVVFFLDNDVNRKLHSFPTRRSSDLSAIVSPCRRILRMSSTMYVGGMSLAHSWAQSGSMATGNVMRSEEHTSELQSHSDLVCRLLLEKKKWTLLRKV